VAEAITEVAPFGLDLCSGVAPTALDEEARLFFAAVAAARPVRAGFRRRAVMTLTPGGQANESAFSTASRN
jgi:hypothetical protein